MTRSSFNATTLACLLVVNFLAHFVPFERPGFEQDDYFWLHLSRQWPSGEFASVGLSQDVRPLGSTLFMAIPSVLGLHAGTQLALLIASTSVLTTLGYLYLCGVFTPHAAALATFFFIVWPVKHEIYGDQLIVVNTVAACFVLAAALLYRHWTRSTTVWPLLASSAFYLLSLLTYEIGFLSPLVFMMANKPARSPARAAAAFVVPACLYFLLRFTTPAFVIATGQHEFSLSGLVTGMLSLPSNLVGFQLARNTAYGLWGVWNAPDWFRAFVLIGATLTAIAIDRLVKRAKPEVGSERSRALARAGIASAFLLAAPAAFVLVESRHSVLAAFGMAAFLTAIAVRLPAFLVSAGAIILLVATQGLALRQAEVSSLQASVNDVIRARRDSVRTATAVVFDVRSLADRVPYTWGDRSTNVLNSYWGLPGLSAGGLNYMVDAALTPTDPATRRRVSACGGVLTETDDRITCDRSMANQRPFSIRREGVVTIEFSTMPLPSSIRASAPTAR